MKTRLASALVATALAGCAARTTYIGILQPERIYEYGRPKFEVVPGDQLQVLYAQTCRGGVGRCWAVMDVTTGRTGFVSVEAMKDRHRVYRMPKGMPPVAPDRGPAASARPQPAPVLRAGEAVASDDIGAARSGLASEPVRIGPTVAQPRLLNQVAPKWPGVEGRADVEAHVSESGEVTHVEPVRSDNDAVAQAAIEAVQQWRYAPLLVDGQPRSFILTVTVHFDRKGP